MQIYDTLGTNRYTTMECEDSEDQKFNSPHHFTVFNADNGDIIQEINFQEGPIRECSVNGVANEDLLIMVKVRLENFQKSEFKSRDNAIAIEKIEEALLWLRKRTMDRESRGVEGTCKV